MPEKEPSVVHARAQMSGSSSMRANLTVFRRPPIDHPVYALIGRVASDWAYLEHRLDEIIWGLTGSPWPLMGCITAQIMGHYPRFNAIIALLTYHHMNQKLIDFTRKQSGAVAELAEERNRVVHDAWYMETDRGEPHRYKSMSKKELEFGLHPHSISEIEELLKKISSRVEAVNRLAEQITAARHP
jgi:hypothetical protein